MLSSLVIFLTWVVWIVALIIVIVMAIVALFLHFAPTFGGKPDAISQKRIANSANFNGKTFVNLVATQAATIKIDNITAINNKQASVIPNNSPKINNVTYAPEDSSLIRNFLFPPKGKNPSQPIATQSLNFAQQQLQEGQLVWLGHSTVLFRTANKTLITDPVFHRASPVILAGKPFAMTHAPKAADLPFVDIVLISHDHYDHLDHQAIKKMHHNVGHFYVPLGVKAHLLRWGVAEDKISEYDWYDEVMVDDIRLVFTPTRHFSGRGIFNHRTTLWGSWVVKSPNLSAYFSGDGGYSPEFANIGERYGDFDIAFIEDGAYNLRWRDVHMMPEESAQAGIDVKAKVVLPIHWGKFDLSTHQWTEPVKRIKAAMNQHNQTVPESQHIQITTPRVGQVFDLHNLPTQAWWEEA